MDPSTRGLLSADGDTTGRDWQGPVGLAGGTGSRWVKCPLPLLRGNSLTRVYCQLFGLLAFVGASVREGRASARPRAWSSTIILCCQERDADGLKRVLPYPASI